ncbi:MAG: PQQ-dependent sugar dehydrogenase [Candidatus Binatia bacterium]
MHFSSYVLSPFFLLIPLCVCNYLVPAWAQTVALQPYVGGFSLPVAITHAGDGSHRLFVVEQAGTIRIIKNHTLLPQPFLDISNRTTGTGERGLLGLAFAPDYKDSGVFYVNYTNLSGTTIIARYRVTANPDVADPNSEEILLSIPQPFANHNGGQLAFGPDGYLYIGMGDGGGGGDPAGNGQNPASLLGKILRLHVTPRRPSYRIPPSNPYLNAPGFRGEIWALGLRNPWRLSFDRHTGDLYMGDVGQGAYEEVNVQSLTSPGGENYGWDILEGSHCFDNPSCTPPSGAVAPVLEYPHQNGDCAVIGGAVYRGVQYPRLHGVYVYSDFCTSRIWGLERDGASWQNTLLFGPDNSHRLSAFGEGEDGELYAADWFDSGVGKILRVTETTAVTTADLSLAGVDFPDPVALGSNLTYSFTVTNAGAALATGGQLSTLLPSNVSFVSASTPSGSCMNANPVICTLNPLANGANATVTLVVIPTTCGTLKNVAYVAGDEADPTAGNNTVTTVTVVSGSGCHPPPCNGSTRRKCF